VISPPELGIQYSSLDKIQVKNSEESYRVFLDVLNGTKGSPQDAVVLNSAVALYAANITGSIEDGLSLARTSIEDGKVLQILGSLVDVSNSF
jgi:anthranilate phosphoribosyltransferase